MRKLYAVGTADELEPGDRLRVDVSGTDLVVANVEGRYYAFRHACPHESGPLGDGKLEGFKLTCPSHRWVYDVRAGTASPSDRPQLTTYRVKILNNEILVEVPESPPRPEQEP